MGEPNEMGTTPAVAGTEPGDMPAGKRFRQATFEPLGSDSPPGFFQTEQGVAEKIIDMPVRPFQGT
jgi:hypothetical protein